jgi:hypothetical protein
VDGGEDSLLQRADARWWWQALSASIVHAENWQSTALVEQTELLIESAPRRRERIADSSRGEANDARDLARVLAPWLAAHPISAAQRVL